MTGQHRMPASVRRPPAPDRARALTVVSLGAGFTFCLGLLGASHPVVRADVTAAAREPVAVAMPDLPTITVVTQADTLSAATPPPVPVVHTRRPTTAVRPSQRRTAAPMATVAPTTATAAAPTTAPTVTTTADTTTAAETTTTAPTTTATTEPTLLPTTTDVLPTALPVETTSEETTP